MGSFLRYSIGAAGVFAGLQEYAYWVETSHPGAPGEQLAVWLVELGLGPEFLRPAADVPLPAFPQRTSAVRDAGGRSLGVSASDSGALWSVTFALDNTSDYADALNHGSGQGFTRRCPRRPCWTRRASACRSSCWG